MHGTKHAHMHVYIHTDILTSLKDRELVFNVFTASRIPHSKTLQKMPSLKSYGESTTYGQFLRGEKDTVLLELRMSE